jgi:hypothetical protein
MTISDPNALENLLREEDPALELAHDAQAAVAAAGTPLSALASDTDDEDDEDDVLETLEGRVDMAGGERLDVSIVNRDFVAWDMTRGKKKWPAAEEAPFLLNNFLAYTALRREGRYSGPFEAFVEAATQVKLVRGTAARPTR